MPHRAIIVTWLTEGLALEGTTARVVRRLADALYDHPCLQTFLREQAAVASRHTAVLADLLRRLGGQPVGLWTARRQVERSLRGLALSGTDDEPIRALTATAVALHLAALRYRVLTTALAALGERELKAPLDRLAAEKATGLAELERRLVLATDWLLAQKRREHPAGLTATAADEQSVV